MRFRSSSLRQPLEEALEKRMLASGHEVAASLDEADAIAVGVLAPGLGTPLLEADQALWEETTAALRDAFVTVRDFARTRLERDGGGRVVLVVDPPALRVAEGAGLAAVAGGFLTTLAQVGALDLGPHGIAVNVLVAGWAAPAPAGLASGVPLGGLAEADQVASACAFLLSPEQAGYVNGAVLAADGGWFISKAAGGSPLTAD